MRIILENTVYSLFLYILIDKDWKKRTYILDKKVLENLSLKNIKRKNFKKKYNIRDNLLLFYLQKIEFLFLKFYWVKNKNITLYGDINMLNELKIKKNFFVIEDGIASYRNKKNIQKYFYIFKKIIKLENVFNKLEPTSPLVKKIYLTGLSTIPKEIENKVEIINIKKLWALKSKNEKKEILEFFNFKEEVISKIRDKKEILFTQPLSEDRIMTENEKINLYTKIIKKYNQETLIIKTHPREKTNYRKIFPYILILDDIFPSEFFTLFNINFDRAITLFSTAVLNLKNVKEIDFYGTEVHEELLKTFGSLNNIYLRNSFLE